MIGKDVITVDVNSDHSADSNTNVLGREGEGNISQLAIRIPQGLIRYDIYIDFKMPNGETVRTPRLEVESGVAHYSVPQYILTESGDVEMQLVFQNENEEIWKSSVKGYSIAKSINAVDEIPNKEDFISEAQKVLDELSGEVDEIANKLSNNADFVATVANKIDTDGTELRGEIDKINSIVMGNTWVLDAKLDEEFDYTFNFSSNGNNYIRMKSEISGTNTYLIHYYVTDKITTTVYSSAISRGWIDEAHRTIITENGDISITDIATKITEEVPIVLNTNAKTVIGAINEVNNGIRFIGAYYNPDDKKWYWEKDAEGHYTNEIDYNIFGLTGGGLIDLSLFEINLDQDTETQIVEFCWDRVITIWEHLPPEAVL